MRLAFSALIDQVYARHGRIDVVIHGAGIIEDKLIRDKTPASFDRVVHTKADSSFILLQKLRFADLKCLVFMSSISAALGNRGQADYAAANGIMNGIASTLAAENPGQAVALNWGPWDRAGMVSQSVRDQFLVSGVQMIDCDGGCSRGSGCHRNRRDLSARDRGRWSVVGNRAPARSGFGGGEHFVSLPRNDIAIIGLSCVFPGRGRCSPLLAEHSGQGGLCFGRTGGLGSGAFLRRGVAVR